MSKRRDIASTLTPGIRGQVSNWGNPSLVKSVQAGVVILAGAASATTTITAVVVANTVLLWLGTNSSVGTADPEQAFCRITLTNATTVTGNKNTATGTASAGFTVLEFVPGVLKSVQLGTVAISSSAAGTATVSAVNTAKAALWSLGWDVSDTSGSQQLDQVKLILTNATTVTANIGASSSLNANFCLAEFF